MNILPVLFGFAASLNCKFGATVEATEAHCAFFFYPNGFAALNFNRINGAFLCTESAAAAAFFNGKRACAPKRFIAAVEFFAERYAP